MYQSKEEWSIGGLTHLQNQRAFNSGFNLHRLTPAFRKHSSSARFRALSKGLVDTACHVIDTHFEPSSSTTRCTCARRGVRHVVYGARHIIHHAVYRRSPRQSPHSVPMLATSFTT
jgi:hypothetical protein